jgi:hypothetical protein
VVRAHLLLGALGARGKEGMSACACGRRLPPPSGHGPRRVWCDPCRDLRAALGWAKRALAAAQPLPAALWREHRAALLALANSQRVPGQGRCACGRFKGAPLSAEPAPRPPSGPLCKECNRPTPTRRKR